MAKSTQQVVARILSCLLHHMPTSSLRVTWSSRRRTAEKILRFQRRKISDPSVMFAAFTVVTLRRTANVSTAGTTSNHAYQLPRTDRRISGLQVPKCAADREGENVPRLDWLRRRRAANGKTRSRTQIVCFDSYLLFIN